MFCDIQAEFHAKAIDPHIIQGSLHLSNVEDRIIDEIEVDLVGLVSYLCPTFNNGNNFMDPEKPSFQLMETRFLNQSKTFTNPQDNVIDYEFNLPHQFELTESMRKRLGLARGTNRDAFRFRLPPSFAEEQTSYLQSFFIPWKEPSKAAVNYTIKVSVKWHIRVGVSRLLKTRRQKSFRKAITVMPPSTSDIPTLLPRYTGTKTAHWHREIVPASSGTCTDDLCSVMSTSKATLRLFSEHGLRLDHPIPFHLELKGVGENYTGSTTLVKIDLIRTVSTKMRAGRREVERRNHSTLVNRLLVQANGNQAGGDSIDHMTERLNDASFETTDCVLKGSISLLDDSAAKQALLAPSFTFAGLSIEYRLQLHVSTGNDHFSFYTPAVVIESEPEPSPPPYVSLSL